MTAPSTALTIVGGGGAAAPAETGLTMHELPTLLKQWMTLETEVTKLNAEMRERRKQAKALREAILKIMDKHNVVQLNVNRGAVLHKVREKKDMLSASYLSKTAEAFFEGDKEKAAQLVKYLEEHRTSTVVHDLRFAAAKGESINM
jgi:Family of unknown function (DUF5760)